MVRIFDVGVLVPDFDPAEPHLQFRAAGLDADLMVAGSALPRKIPRPAGTAPTPILLASTPAQDRRPHSVLRLLRGGLDLDRSRSLSDGYAVQGATVGAGESPEDCNTSKSFAL